MPIRRTTHWWKAAVAVTFALMSASSVDAAPGSRICRQIEAQLSSGGGSQAREYAGAIQRQRTEIAKVRGQLRAQGCGFFSSGGSCRSLSASVSRMERNLSNLQRTHSRLGGGGRSRGQLLAALSANDCRGTRSASQDRDNSILSRLVAPLRRDDSSFAFPDRDFDAQEINKPRERQRGNSIFEVGGYRTFCVRTCDGYFFPMSPSSSRSDLARDAQNCRTGCPGTETMLYYHDGNEEEAGKMVSAASGTEYRDLPNAFLYKSETAQPAAGCSCGFKPQGFTVVAGGSTQTVGAPVEMPLSGAQRLPTPTWRPDPGMDPETLLNREGRFGPKTIRKLLSKDDGAADERKVRVVGPVFLPDPSMARGQQVPGPTEVR